MVSNGYLLLEIISLMLIFTAFFVLINAKKRDITRYLRNKLSGIFFLVIAFIIVFILGTFISFLAIIAFVISFILLLIGFVFSKKVEIRRSFYKKSNFVPKPVNPEVVEAEAEEVINKLEKEVKTKKVQKRKKTTKKKTAKKSSKRRK